MIAGMNQDVQQNRAIDEHAERLRAIEHNLKRLLATVNLAWEEPPPLPVWPAEVLQLLQEGNKIGAIKALATLRRLGLAEAKELIERGP